LLGLVEPSQHPDYFYVKKIDNHHLLESAYDGNLVQLDSLAMNHLTSFYDNLLEFHINIVPYREGYYLTKISTGECLICYDYIWNGPFHDVCKHNHAARIYQQSQQSQTDNLLYQKNIKADLVNYFKNKQRVLPAEKKNELIYNGDIETAFNEIVKIFELQGISNACYFFILIFGN
jgi:hypothetical protein